MRGRSAWRIGALACGFVCLLLMGMAEGDGPVLIGALNDSWGPTPAEVGLRDGLVEMGYRENEQFVIGVRFTQGKTDALPAAARELISQGVHILFTSQPGAAVAAHRATDRIPIVFTDVGDPVGLGLIKSFARPGSNITGITTLGHELAPKRLQVFQEMVPGLKRVLFPYNPTHPYAAGEVDVYREAAQQLGIELIEKPVQTQQEARMVISSLQKTEVDGIITPRPLSLNIPGLVLEVASQKGIPTMFHTSFWTDGGGLASYGPDFRESGRMAARLVNKLIQGKSPSTIPVEVNHKIEFVINLKTAKKLGLTIAPEVLYQANRIIR